MKSSLTDTQNSRKPFKINVDDVDINTVVCIKTSFQGDDLEHISFTTAWLYTPARMSNFSKLSPPLMSSIAFHMQMLRTTSCV